LVAPSIADGGPSAIVLGGDKQGADAHKNAGVGLASERMARGPRGDRRFKDGAWSQSPFYDLLKQSICSVRSN